MVPGKNDVKKGSPGRPRSKQVTEMILSTTLLLLEKEGYKTLSMELIAKTAGAGKQTLYRWWPNKASIVLEAVRTQCELEILVPELGSVKQDLLEYISNTCRLLNGPTGKIIAALIAEAQFNDEFSLLLDKEFISTRREALVSILKKGMERGEISNNKNLNVLSDFCYGAIWYRFLNRHAPLDEEFIEHIVETLVS